MQNSNTFPHCLSYMVLCPFFTFATIVKIVNLFESDHEWGGRVASLIVCLFVILKYVIRVQWPPKSNITRFASGDLEQFKRKGMLAGHVLFNKQDKYLRRNELVRNIAL